MTATIKCLTEIATSKAELSSLLTKEVKSFSPKRSFVSRKHLSTEKAESLQKKFVFGKVQARGKRKAAKSGSGTNLLIALFAPKARHDSTNEKIALSVIRAPCTRRRERSSTRQFLCTEAQPRRSLVYASDQLQGCTLRWDVETIVRLNCRKLLVCMNWEKK